MTKKELKCLDKFYNYLLDNNNDITISELEVALDTYNTYQTFLHKLENNISISKENYEIFNELNIYSNDFKEMFALLNKLERKRFNEIYNLLQIYKSDNTWNRKYVNMYENIPFKGTNVDIEKVIFSKLLSNCFILDNYSFLILSLLNRGIEKEYADISSDDIGKIFSWINEEDIKYSSFGYDGEDFTQYRINKKRNYGTDEDIRNTYLARPNDSYAIGNYAELVVFKLQKKYLIATGRPDLAQRVKWVARDVGDGFGYDILSFDPYTSEEVIIEVKGTNRKENEFSFQLTNKENNLFKYYGLFPNPNNKYIVYHVFIDKYNDKDIYPISIVECKKDQYDNVISINQCEMEYEEKEDSSNVYVANYKKKYLYKVK